MTLRPILLTALILLTTCGCRTSDPELARRALSSQAAQNRAMADLQREVAAGARELTAADAEARHQSIELHQQIQTERGELSAGWSDLNSQRRSDSASLRRDSFLSAVVQGGGATAAALFALAIVLSVLNARCHEEGVELARLMLEAVPQTSDFPIPPHHVSTSAPQATMRLTAQPQEPT